MHFMLKKAATGESQAPQEQQELRALKVSLEIAETLGLLALQALKE